MLTKKHQVDRFPETVFERFQILVAMATGVKTVLGPPENSELWDSKKCRNANFEKFWEC